MKFNIIVFILTGFVILLTLPFRCMPKKFDGQLRR